MTEFWSRREPPTPAQRRKARLWLAGAIVGSVLVIVGVALATGSVLAGIFTLMDLGVASTAFGLIGLAILTRRQNRR